MRRIRLTTAEQEHLEHTFKTTSDRRLRDRCQAVLMASRGRKRRAIAQDLGVHRTTVRLWLKQYQERGLGGLHIHWAPGQPGRIPETLAPTIQSWVKDGPLRCGLDRANWTYEGHCQVNVKSLSDAFPLRKAEGLGIPKTLGLVKAQNLL